MRGSWIIYEGLEIRTTNLLSPMEHVQQIFRMIDMVDEYLQLQYTIDKEKEWG